MAAEAGEYAILAASGNRLAREVIHTISTEAFRSMCYIGETTHQDCVDSNVEHRLIFEKLMTKDGVGAADAMRSHILRAWRHRRPTARGQVLAQARQ